MIGIQRLQPRCQGVKEKKKYLIKIDRNPD